MKKELLDYYCASLKDTFALPVTTFRKDTGEMDMANLDLQLLSSVSLYQTEFAKRYSGKALFDTSRMVSYYISDDDIAFGCISDMNGKYCVYIGPCLLADLTENLLNNMMRRWNSPFQKNPEKYRDSLHAYLKTLPRISQERFMELLRFTNVFVNNLDMSEKDFTVSNLSKKVINVREYTEASLPEGEKIDTLREVRDTLLSLVKTGDVSGIESYWTGIRNGNPLFSFEEDSPLDILRQSKNLFIRLTAFIETELLRENYPERQLKEISDRNIKDAENIISYQQLYPVYVKMLKEYAELVKKKKTEGKCDNLLVNKALEYIHNHIRENISVDDISDSINVSRGHLSRLFGQKMKTSIPDYVRKEKIDVAKTLLENSDIRTIDLSYYLSFSSQSYFQNVFKKETGATPGEYRKKVSSSGLR